MAIGFEFGTNIKVCRLEKSTFRRKITEVGLPKETQLWGGRHTSLGWSLETDGKEVELVIDPPISEDDEGAQRLGQIFASIKVYFEKLERARREGVTRIVSPDRRFFNATAQKNLAITLPNTPIAAQPQVTVGVRLGRVRMLFEEMARLGAHSPFVLNKGSAFYPDRAGANAALARQAGLVNGHRPSEHLRGMLTMLAQYLQQGSSTGSRAYVKYMTYAMARTDFVGMFKRLRTREKTYFREDPQRWVDYVLQTTGFAGQGQGRVINFPITDGESLDRVRAEFTLTRERWLRGMAEGRDLLTQAATLDEPEYQDVHGGHRLRAMGLLGARTDRVGPLGENHGVVIEFRTIRKGVRWQEWHLMAHQFVTYVARLNASSKAELRANPAELGWQPA